MPRHHPAQKSNWLMPSVLSVVLGLLLPPAGLAADAPPAGDTTKPADSGKTTDAAKTPETTQTPDTAKSTGSAKSLPAPTPSDHAASNYLKPVPPELLQRQMKAEEQRLKSQATLPPPPQPRPSVQGTDTDTDNRDRQPGMEMNPGMLFHH